VRGATLRGDDVVEHFMATSNHHWLLFFTTAGRVYRTKAYNLPEASRDAKGGHVAGLLSFQPDESIAQVLAIRDYEQAPYLVLATRNGLVKKTRLGDYNSPRQAGVIAINFREDDDVLIGAELVNAEDDILLVSRKGQAIRFRADDTQLRPMGRATSGVSGMKFRDGDSLLSMSVIRAEQVAAEEAAAEKLIGAGEAPDSIAPGSLPDVVEQYVFTITDGGFAKRTRISDYRLQSRGGIGIKAMSLANEDRGGLVGAFIVVEGDEILSITQNGQVVRSPINDAFRATGRSTMGVKFVSPKGNDAVAVVARSVEAKEEEVLGTDDSSADDSPAEDVAVEGATGSGEDAVDVTEPSAESVEDAAGATIEATTENTDPDTFGESEA
jgi:DNA gyrase subunit A